MLIEKYIFENALKYLIRFTDKRTNVLESVFIDIKNNSTTLFTTDTKIGAKITVPITTDDEKTICTSANRLYNILYLIDDQKINLDFVNNNIKISAGSYISQIKTYDHNLFPDLFNDIPEANIILNKETLHKALEKVLFATAKKSFKPEYEGINLVINNEGLSFCATNSFRLSYFNDQTTKMEKEINIIIPKQFLLELLGMPVDEEQIKIGVTSDYLIVESGNIKLFSRLINGHFPDYKNIIQNTENEKLATIEADKLSKAIKKVLFVTEKGNHSVIFNFDGENLSIESSNEEGEFAKEMIKIKSTENRKLKLNGKMLVEYLSTVADHKIDLFCDSDDNPVQFIPNDIEYTLKYIQMPIN
ncbi:MAG: DNA polymerase III subunit beta [Epsilonproteobacteria bacterium]|nr:DNA polymerase III subunit beta [Campylobacterota bacterium]